MQRDPTETNKRYLVLDFLRCKTSEGTPIPLEQVSDELMSTIVAGSNSVASAIMAIIYYLGSHPQVYSKLVTEIKEAGASGKLSNPVVKYNGSTKLPYLAAVVKESSRLCPSFAGNWYREVPKGGYEILPGVIAPGGTDVCMNTYVTRRDKWAFGGDAEEFVPERWLPLEGECAKRMDKFHWSFGYSTGSRVFLGRNIARLEINKSIIELIRTFDLRLRDPERDLKAINYHQMCISDLWVTLEERATKL
ncbi:hypothetical protein RUND412_000191 [Rhizina undulata]